MVYTVLGIFYKVGDLMLPRDELLESIDILVQHAVKETTQIYTATVIGVNNNNTCSIRVNGKSHTGIAYYGEAPTINRQYRVFTPNGSMNQAFIITGGGSGDGSTGTTDYNALSNKPSINNNTLSGNQTSSQLGLYGTNNPPPYPVTSVNGQTGDVTIATGGNVDSVNGKTGDVVLDASDVGALPSTTVIPSKTSQLTNDSGYVNQTQAKNAAPVQSVDGETGAVVTNAVKTTEQLLTDAQKQQARENIGAGTSSFDGDYNSLFNTPTIPTKVSQLENDSDYATESQVDAKYTKPTSGIPKSDLSSDVQASLDKANTALQTAPVTSVNGATGAVDTIFSFDIYINVYSSDTVEIYSDLTCQELYEKGTDSSISKVAGIARGGQGLDGQFVLIATPMALVGSDNFEFIGAVTTQGAEGIYRFVTNSSNSDDSVGGYAKKIAPIDIVNSINGQSGDVFLSKSDVGLENVDNVKQYSASNPPPYPVTSVAGKTGAVSLSKTDVSLGNVDNVRQYSESNPPPYPVTSVNNKTDAVQLDASDVGALPDTTVIPSKTSDLTNDSGFITDIPIASSTQLGGVKVGAGLSVSSEGTLSATGGGTADAVEWKNVLDTPTTIAGYGITDAKIDNGTITLGNQSITPLTSETDDIYMVVLTGDGSDDNPYVADKAFEDVLNAANNGKFVCLYNTDEKVVYTLTKIVGSYLMIFAITFGLQNVIIQWMQPDIINRINYILERTLNKVTTISASSTNTQYPSAKAVWDALSTAGSGDMLKSVYDSTSAVENAGGIVDYVATKIPEIPTNIVKYTTLAPVESTTPIDANTLQGHDAAYFATQSGLNTVDAKTATNASNISSLQSSVSSLNSAVNTKLPISGGTMTGALVAQTNTNYTTRQVRNVIISTAEPSGGQNGDIWIRYSE